MTGPGVFLLESADDAPKPVPIPSDARPSPTETQGATSEGCIAPEQLPPLPMALMPPGSQEPTAPAALPERLTQLNVPRLTPLPLTLTPFARALLRR